MQINNVNNTSVYDASNIKIGQEKQTENIVNEISNKVQSGASVKPFKAVTYRVGDKSELAKTVAQTNKLISSIASVLSNKTAQTYISNGFDLDNMSLDKLGKLIKNGDKSAIQNVNKGLESADKYLRTLSEKNLPINDSNISKMKRAYEAYGRVKSANKSERLSILSAVSKGSNSLKSISAAMKVRPKQTSVNMRESKISSHLEKLGFNPNEQNISNAKELLCVNLAVNKKNMDFLGGSNEIFSDKKMLSSIADNIAKLGSGMDAELDGLAGESADKNAQTIEKVKSIDDTDIEKAVELGKTKSIKEVLSTREENAQGINAEAHTEKTEINSEAKSEATLRREIEEVRLKLNLENAKKLEKAGINPETKELSKLVEKLREIEKQELKKEMEILDAKVINKEINKVYDDKLLIEKLKNFRLDFKLNLEERGEFSLENFSAKASVLSVDKYLISEIRADLGDSVTKSFTGIESRLESLGIIANEQSIAACKALIRSGLDVSAENVARVEIIGEQIDFLTKNLTPEVLLKMNRAGIDLKSLPLNEVVDLTRLYKSDGVENRLAKLIARAYISDADYKDIMATYKAIYKGLKKDGVAIANLLKSGADINIKNLKVFSGYKGYSDNINSILEESAGLNENAKPAEKSANLFELEKVLVQFKLAKVVKNLTGENIKTVLTGSERERLSFDDLARVLESELSEKEYFDTKTGEIVKKLITLKIPVSFSNIDRAKKLAKNSFHLIEEIASAVDQIDNEDERSRVANELKKIVSEKTNSKEDLENALMELKADVDSEEFGAKERFESAIKDMKFADEFEEVFFQLPYFSGDELRQLNIFSKEREHDEEDEIEVVLSLKTKTMGEKNISLNILENRVSLFVKVDNEEERASFRAFGTDFEKAVKDAGFYFAGMNFSKLEEVTKDSVEVDNISSIISFKV